MRIRTKYKGFTNHVLLKTRREDVLASYSTVFQFWRSLFLWDWQCSTEQGLRQADQKLLANKVWNFSVWPLKTADQQIGEALKLWALDTINTQDLKDNGSSIYLLSPSLALLQASSHHCPHPRCLSFSLSLTHPLPPYKSHKSVLLGGREWQTGLRWRDKDGM